jgi:CHASE3 domain sensor protein
MRESHLDLFVEAWNTMSKIESIFLIICLLMVIIGVLVFLGSLNNARKLKSEVNNEL